MSRKLCVKLTQMENYFRSRAASKMSHNTEDVFCKDEHKFMRSRKRDEEARTFLQETLAYPNENGQR
ncbi:hypothetical protein NECAME_09997 [Necator americanus]|uniref:Uncharacterized protein n=1 Tax=Necator americanus TaxID=51031 RepID=W2TC02_NECAM|nr:hypothetical protein NECAME_09997 [Necator americanus]ETN79129.1 hypothetical protein NECAME_09997 [Necator americanus]